MRGQRSFVVGVLGAALVAAFLPEAARAARFQVRTLSNPADTVSERRARVAGDVVVWQSGSGAFSEVMLFDGEDVVNLSNNGIADENPETDGVHVVWQQSSGATHNIAVHDLLTQGTSILVSSGDEITPVVSGTTLAWVEMVDADGEVFIDPGPLGNQLTGNVLVESSLILSGPDLVFVQGDDLDVTPDPADDLHDIGIWNGVLGEFYILGGPATDDIRPSIAGDVVVWQSGSDPNGDIWVGDTQGTSNPLFDGDDERNPHTDGQLVVWDHFDGADRDIARIHLATPGVVSFVTNDNVADDVTPQVSGDDIVWVRESTPGDSEIWVSWDGAPPSVVGPTSNNGRDEVRPQLAGEHIVWESCLNLGQPNELCDVVLAPEPRATLLAAAALCILGGLATRSAQRAVALAKGRSAR